MALGKVKFLNFCLFFVNFDFSQKLQIFSPIFWNLFDILPDMKLGMKTNKPAVKFCPATFVGKHGMSVETLVF